MSKISKVSVTELRDRVLQIVGDAGQPIAVDVVAESIGIGWGTARAILLELALHNQITALKTSKGWVFLPRSQKLVEVHETFAVRKKGQIVASIKE